MRLLVAVAFMSVLSAFFAAFGCTTKVVRAKDTRVITTEEAARLARAREAARSGGEDGSGATGSRAVFPPANLAEEAERLRAEVEREPQNPKWHFLLGHAYERQSRLELAELRYRKGAELIPSGQYTGPHYFLGRVLAKQGKFAAALAELRKAVAVRPPDPEGYYLNPDYRESYYLIGAISYAQGDLGEAEKAFRLFLKYGGEPRRAVEFFPELVAE